MSQPNTDGSLRIITVCEVTMFHLSADRDNKDLYELSLQSFLFTWLRIAVSSISICILFGLSCYLTQA